MVNWKGSGRKLSWPNRTCLYGLHKTTKQVFRQTKQSGISTIRACLPSPLTLQYALYIKKTSIMKIRRLVGGTRLKLGLVHVDTVINSQTVLNSAFPHTHEMNKMSDITTLNWVLTSHRIFVNCNIRSWTHLSIVTMACFVTHFKYVSVKSKRHRSA